MPRPQPYTVYRGVQIFLYQEVGRNPNEWGAAIRWPRQQYLTDVDGEKETDPTFEHMLAAAHRFIDALMPVETKDSADPTNRVMTQQSTVSFHYVQAE